MYQRLVETARTHHRSLAKEIVVALERHVAKPEEGQAGAVAVNPPAVWEEQWSRAIGPRL
jgi:hypothetical protein